MKNIVNNNAEGNKTTGLEAVAQAVVVRMGCRTCGLAGADSALRS
jgi:hypothetical protein